MKGETTDKRWTSSSRDELEAAVRKAVRARAPDFKAKANSLTFEGARRMIEQDLHMKQFLLDAHKKYFKHCMEECISIEDGEETPEPSRCTESKTEKSTVEEPGETQNTSELKNNGASNFDEAPASETEIRNDSNEVSEDMIKEAIKQRALFFQENLETISLMRVRRLLEEDLKLPTKALDVHKAFVSTELEKALASLEMNKSENGAQKKPKKGSQKVEKSQASKASKRTHEDSGSSDNASKDSRVEKKRKLAVSKVKESTKNSASQKNSVDKKKSIASSKSKKVKRNERRDDSEEREASNSSDKNESRSSDEEEDTKKRREKPTPQVYGKKVEHLKGIIKSCGLSIPPAVYKRAKQAPEDKRETCLIKELEEILEKEGLSTNPSEKEIKEVKKRKERAKELEGIDTSNIITSSRRRGSAFSYIPPPKPPKLEFSSDDDNDDEDDDDDDDDDVDLEKGDANDDDEDGDGDRDGGDEGNDGGAQGGDKDNGDGDTNDSGNHRGGEGNDNKGDEDKGSGQDGADDSH